MPPAGSDGRAGARAGSRSPRSRVCHSPRGTIIQPQLMSLTPGATLGPYAIRVELGHGGMGVVYTAHDPRLKRQVAIKLLVPDLTRDETAKRRFLQEAQAASALDHPNHLHDLRDQRDTRRPALPRDGVLRGGDAEAADRAGAAGAGRGQSTSPPRSGRGSLRRMARASCIGISSPPIC